MRTGEGDDSAENLFWNNGGDLALLKDPEGNVVSMYPEEEKEA